MEYEQVEYGRRVVTEAITRQDINSYYDLLSPAVLLVTHFPYPKGSSDSNVQAIEQWMHLSQQQRGSVKGCRPAKLSTASDSSESSRRRGKELLQAQVKQRERQQRRYEDFRKRREGHHSSTTEGTAADTADNAAGEPVTKAPPAGGGGDAAAAQVAAEGAATGAESARRREPSTKSTVPKKASATVGSSGCSARVPLGVRWFRQQQQQQQQQLQHQGGAGVPVLRSPAMPGRANLTPAVPSVPGAGPVERQKSSPAGVAAAALSYEDVVDIAEGRLMASFRFFELLHWISTGSGVTHIAPVEVDVQLRKDILQEEEVLAPPPPPTTVQEQYEQLGTQFTERNQPLSCVTVIWGGDYLLFKDKVYFDDGLIVTIQRTMLSVPEVVARATPLPSWNPQQQQQQQQRLSNRRHLAGGPSSPLSGKQYSAAATQAEQVHKAVEAFYGVSASRVNALNTSWPLLDYSFLEAPEPFALLRLAPASGHVHVNRPPRAAADPRLAQGVFLNQSNDPGVLAAQQASAGRTLIKAKNKQGEEEAYEVNDNRSRFLLLQQDSGVKGEQDGVEVGDWDGLGGGAATNHHHNPAAVGKGSGEAGNGGNVVRVERYDASCVRVSGCHLQAKVEQLVPVLRRLVANSLLTLHTLDLSQNCIATLPDLRLLPLQNLKLHDNAIADWRVVEHSIAPLPYLSVLTLHGNPIAEEAEAPRSAAVSAGKGAASNPPRSKAGVAAASASGESSYWKRLLTLLLANPARVAPLRQVDFVTLTAQDFNVAGAYALFMTGKSDVLDRARAMSAGASRNGAGTAARATARGAE
jgi:hypothetical protein